MSELTHCGSARSRITNGEMKQMRRDGYTVREIAERAGLPRTTVGCRLRAWGIKPEVKVIVEKLKPEHYAVIEELYWDKLMNVPEISAYLGLPESTISSRMASGGIPRRSRSESMKLNWSLGKHPVAKRKLEQVQ